MKIDHFDLLRTARIYLFLQLFSTPILLTIFSETALPSIIEDNLYFPLATSFSQESITISIIAFTCFFLGGTVPFRAKARNPIAFDWHSPKIEQLFWIVFIFGFLFKAIRFIAGGDIQVSSAKISIFDDKITYFLSLNWFHRLALPFLAIAYYENKKSKNKAANYYPLTLTFYLVNGAMNASTSFVAIPLVTHFAIRQRYKPISLKSIPFIALALTSTIYLKAFWKVLVINDPDNLLSIYAPLIFLINRISNSFVITAISNDPSFSYGYGILEQFFNSLRIPGYEYATPDGNYFGRYYSIIRQTDFVTGVAITVAGDLFLQWRYLGVSLGMFLLGTIYKWVSSFSQTNDRLHWIIYSLLWPIMLHGLESPVSVLLADSIKMAALCVTYSLIGHIFLSLQNKTNRQ